jgi:serine/threonine-protein kinase
VEGQTLETVLEKNGGRLPLRQSLLVAKQLLEGIGFAHSKRVIHRDIKPANIFLSADGRVKIGDFGLAKVMREIKIQRTEIRGTPLYMAPEQIHGTDIDHRADLYAIACTLFEIMTGQPPFIDGDVLYHHVHSPPPSAPRAQPAALGERPQPRGAPGHRRGPDPLPGQEQGRALPQRRGAAVRPRPGAARARLVVIPGA